MDGVQQQPPQLFMRVPDHQQRPSQPLPQGQTAPSPSWYPSSQFQFNPQPQPHWDTANPPGYPPPPWQHPPPYPVHHYSSSPFPPPLPPPPPPPPLHSWPSHPHAPHPQSSLSQGFPPPPLSNQAWGNQNWVHQQSWEYQADSPDRSVPPSNEQDWAARARAWAAAKAAMESHQQTTQAAQFLQPVIDKIEEQKNQMYHDHYQQSLAPSSHKQLPVSLTNHPVGPSFSSGAPLSYVSDGSAASFSGSRDGGAFAGTTDANNAISSLHASIPSVYQQEVPSSYTSIPGNEESGNRNEPFSFAMSSHHQAGVGQINAKSAAPTNTGPSVSVEQPYYALGDVPNDSSVDAKSRDDLIHEQANFVHPDSSCADHYTSVSSVHGWAPMPSAPGSVFPPIPAVPSAQQYDSSFLSPSSLSAPVFGRMTGPTSLRSSIPPAVSASTTPFAFGAGATTALHSASVFPGDANGGAFSVSECPKKASVPNWLREEIIKNKSIITSSVQENQHDIGDSPSPGGFRGEDTNRPPRKGDQSYMKGGDSPSRSTVDEDDDDEDDEVEAARITAINQEIKRILTEVLLKVTDELFDEIATKVLNEEDGLEIEVDNSVSHQNHKASPSPSAVPTQKASAKILVPVATVKQGKEAIEQVKDAIEDEASKGNSVSSSPGDVLGLGNYASDDDDGDDEVHSSGVLQSTEQGKDDVSKALNKETNGSHMSENVERSNVSLNGVLQNQKSGVNNGEASPVAHRGGGSGVYDASQMKDEDERSKVSQGRISSNAVESTSDAAIGGALVKPELNTGHHDNSKGNKNVKKVERDIGKGYKGSMKEVRDLRMEEKYIMKERNDESKGSSKEAKDERGSLKQEVEKDQVVKPEEKLRELDSKKFLQYGSSKDGRKEREAATEKSSNGREDRINRKREWEKDNREDRSMRHGDGRDSDRQDKRWHSSSATRGRKSGKPNLFDGHEISGSDDASDRKSRERKQQVKRHSSPSPSRSRRRQVSRSPHSKNSQRRHSPYSSIETRRRRSRSRSRSASPVHRRR